MPAGIGWVVAFCERLIFAVWAESDNEAFPKSTSHILSNPNFAYNPVFSLSTTTGEAKATVVEVTPTAPTFTSETAVVEDRVRVFKSLLIELTLLKVTSEFPATWYCTIESVFIPVNSLPGETNVLPFIIHVFDSGRDDILVLSNTVSALKSRLNPLIKESW